MWISRFAWHRAPPEPVETSWQALAAALSTHLEVPVKDQAPCWAPSWWQPGSPRTKETACGCSALVYDCDHGDSAAWLACIKGLVSARFSFLVYSTHSYKGTNAPGPVKSRIVIELLRAITPAEHRTVWPAFAAQHLPTLVDLRTRDVSRLYWLPSCAPGAPRFAQTFAGRPLDPTPLVNSTDVPEDEPLAPWKIAQDADLIAVQRLWKGRQWIQEKAALDALVNREPIAITGERDNTVYRLVRALVREIPHVTSDSLADLFIPSIAAMGGEPTRDSVRDKIERARQSLTEAPARQAQHRPIVQADAGAEIFIRHPITGTYKGPVARAGAVERIAELLAPDVTAGRLSLVTADGKPKSLGRLVHDYGACVSSVEYEYGRKASGIEDDALILGAAIPPEHTPAYSPRVEMWLRAIAGPHLRDLYTWLVVAYTKPLETLAALVLVADGGVGKNLFAACVASLWGPHARPTDADEALGSFNEGLQECPLILAEERLPQDDRGRTVSALIRKSITDSSVRLNKKHQNLARIRGSVRWLVTVNSDTALRFQEDLSEADIEAIAERLYRIDVPPEVRETTEALGPMQLIAEFPGHIAAVAASWVPVKTTRLWIRQNDSRVAMALAVGGSFRSAVIQWVLGWIMQPGFLVLGRVPMSKIEGDEILVASRDISDGWDCYCPRSKRIELPQIGAALSALGIPKRRRMKERSGERVSCYSIDPDKLIAWAGASRYCTAEDIRNKLRSVMTLGSGVDGNRVAQVVDIASRRGVA